MTKSVWFTWETQRRNKELAEAFECEYYTFDYSNSSRAFRYLKSIFSTFRILVKTRPKVVFAQCPSVVLTALIAALKPFFNFTYVIDAHNAGVEYINSSNIFLSSLANFSFVRADFVILSNIFLKEPLESLGVPFIILADKLPVLHQGKLPKEYSDKKRPIITLVASYATDEPIELFLKAAEQSEHSFSLLVTGSKKKAADLLSYQSEKICFTDFLTGVQYDLLIGNSDLVVDLTTREDCLVCGAYEAVSATVPLLLSDSLVNKETFPKGCVYAENTIESYQEALNTFFSKQEFYQNGIKEMKKDFSAVWEILFREARSLISVVLLSHQ